jgi:hypothetical protein
LENEIPENYLCVLIIRHGLESTLEKDGTLKGWPNYFYKTVFCQNGKRGNL